MVPSVACYMKIIGMFCSCVLGKNPADAGLFSNDLVLNSFALICNALGAKLRWWIDPAGAIVISVGLIYLWGDSARRELMLLCGIAAPKEIQQLVIYKAMTFSQQIIQVDSCKVYHSGTNYVVEVDIVVSSSPGLAWPRLSGPSETEQL